MGQQRLEQHSDADHDAHQGQGGPALIDQHPIEHDGGQQRGNDGQDAEDQGCQHDVAKDFAFAENEAGHGGEAERCLGLRNATSLPNQ